MHSPSLKISFSEKPPLLRPRILSPTDDHSVVWRDALSLHHGPKWMAWPRVYLEDQELHPFPRTKQVVNSTSMMISGSLVPHPTRLRKVLPGTRKTRMAKSARNHSALFFMWYRCAHTSTSVVVNVPHFTDIASRSQNLTRHLVEESLHRSTGHSPANVVGSWSDPACFRLITPSQTLRSQPLVLKTRFETPDPSRADSGPTPPYEGHHWAGKTCGGLRWCHFRPSPPICGGKGPGSQSPRCVAEGAPDSQFVLGFGFGLVFDSSPHTGSKHSLAMAVHIFCLGERSLDPAVLGFCTSEPPPGRGRPVSCNERNSRNNNKTYIHTHKYNPMGVKSLHGFIHCNIIPKNDHSPLPFLPSSAQWRSRTSALRSRAAPAAPAPLFARCTFLSRLGGVSDPDRGVTQAFGRHARSEQVRYTGRP